MRVCWNANCTQRTHQSHLFEPKLLDSMALCTWRSPIRSTRRRPAPPKRRAQQLIDAHLYDPNFWPALLRHPPTADFLAEVLKSRASQDEAFASLVARSCMSLTPTGPTSTPQKRSASSLKRFKSQEPRAGVVPRSLLSAFEESPDIPAKAAKVVPTSQEECFLEPLPLVLAAQIASFLKLREKLLVVASNRQAGALKQLVSAWEPLVLDATDCAYILRRLRSMDPRGYLEPKFYPPPICSAWAEVNEVSVEIMEPDKPPCEGMRPQFHRSSVMARMILDPIEELARRLSAGWLAGAAHLHLSNIEATRMDALFLDFRLKAFRNFPSLKLQHDGLDTNRYCLHASKAPSLLPSIQDARAIMQERFPRRPELQLLLQWPEEITEPEALFLQEHTLMVKAGHSFRNLERLWHVITEEEVRDQYGLLHAELKSGRQEPREAGVIVIAA
ncbi:unnamed protein product [Durusdinium trenchii]|uniref:Uncharacterized protein n=1 Tax=Durusdinium trenchii TaxID=1381693 RepID=A0ABP0N585_9DINO